jgi:hypothetical protein
MFRLRQIVLIASTLLLSWLLMQIVHEFGHIAGALASGGRVEREVLNPLTISRTDVQPNPHPLIVVWAGPLIGALLPLGIWGMASIVKMPNIYLLRFFAGFCLIANGSYIGFGSFGKIGDCGEMLRYGSPTWLLWLFGVATIPTGLWLWTGQGKYFGLGSGVGEVSRRATVATTLILIVVVGLELVFSGR